MNSNDMCELWEKIDLNPERIFYLLECRFKRNSGRTSFDFKSFSPDQPAKIARSSLTLSSTVIKPIENNDETISSESSDEETEDISSPKSALNLAEDDHLDELAEWEPEKSPLPIVENEEEEEDVQGMNEEMAHDDSMDLPIETSTNEVEDLLITFIHYPVKNEPISYDTNLPQLDGQTDFSFDHNQPKRNQNSTPASNISTKSKKSSWEHMILAEQKLNSYRKIKTSESYPMDQKVFPVNIPTCLKSKDTTIKKRKLSVKKRVRSKSKRSLSMGHTGKTLLDYFKVIKRSSTNENRYSPIKTQSNNFSKERPENYFEDCIAIDDDDDLEQVQQYYPIPKNISSREKLLDHAVPSSGMRIKWLLNVESILLEHISICQEETIQSDDSYSYPIDSSLISIIILNFLKIFIIRNSDQDDFSFYQFGITSYLRYFLLELPTTTDCKQYSLIINILFDLLFDLMEYDLCEIVHREKYRSSLIEDDYFIQLKFSKNFDRLKLLIYFIELIGIHRNKCSKTNEEEFLLINEKKIFSWLEDFLQHIFHQINNLKTERISICLNVMELCLLFANEKENYMRQMALFLAKLCEENPTYLHLFLFDRNLFPDIRLLLINELVWKQFHIRLRSIEDLEEFFHRIEVSLRSPNPIDNMTFDLTRSLFDTYADLINSKYSASERITFFLHRQLESIYSMLSSLSQDSSYSEQIKRTVVLFRLLGFKWKRL